LNGVKFGCIPYIGANLSDFYDCDILLHHLPPFKTSTSKTINAGIQEDWGDDQLYYALEQCIVKPQYIFCGHVEHPEATRDKIFGIEIINPGTGYEIISI